MTSFHVDPGSVLLHASARPALEQYAPEANTFSSEPAMASSCGAWWDVSAKLNVHLVYQLRAQLDGSAIGAPSTYKAST